MPRKCLFCESTGITKEHIYSRWIFDCITPSDKSFRPGFRCVVRSSRNEVADAPFGGDFGDGREIPYDNFCVKSVCKQCNNGWMSELESKAKTILSETIKNGLDPSSLSHETAFYVSRWALVKSLLAANATQAKTPIIPRYHELIRK